MTHVNGRTGSPLRVLAVCDRPPSVAVRASDGSTLIAREVLLRLASTCELTLAWFEETSLRPDSELLRRCHRAVPLALGSPLSGATGLALGRPMSVMRRAGASTVRSLRSAAERADVVYLHGPGTLALASLISGPKVVNEIDPMSLVFQDTEGAGVGLGRLSLAVKRRNSRRMEQRAAAAAAEIVLVNPADAAQMARILRRPILALPNGVAPKGERTPRRREMGRICFVGALNYAPNIESATILSRDVLPIVRRHVPEAHVVLAGRDARSQVMELASPSVHVRSDVADVFDVYASSAVAAFPGGRGRGTRNCVLEALRAEVPVVASTVAARGLERGRHLSIADSPCDVADALLGLLSDPRRYADRQQAAASYGASLPTWDDVARQYEELLRAVAAGGPRTALPDGHTSRDAARQSMFAAVDRADGEVS